MKQPAAANGKRVMSNPILPPVSNGTPSPPPPSTTSTMKPDWATLGRSTGFGANGVESVFPPPGNINMQAPHMISGDGPGPTATLQRGLNNRAGQAAFSVSRFGAQPSMTGNSIYGMRAGMRPAPILPHDLRNGGSQMMGMGMGSMMNPMCNTYGVNVNPTMMMGSFYGHGGILQGVTDANSVRGSSHSRPVYPHAFTHTQLGTVHKGRQKYSITFNGSVLSERPRVREPDPDYHEKDHPLSPKASLTTYDVGSDCEDMATDDHLLDVGGAEAWVAKHASLIVEDAIPFSPTSSFRSSGPNTIRSLAIVEDHVGAANAHVKLAANTASLVIGGKVRFEFREAIAYDQSGCEVQSSQVEEVVMHACAGHNAALLIVHDNMAHACAMALVKAAVALIFDTLNNTGAAEEIHSDKVELSLCSIQENKMRDLLKPGSTYGPFSVGSSPLLGPVIMKLTTETIASAAEFDDKLTAAYGAASRSETAFVGTCTLTRVSENDGQRDVSLSLLTFLITGSVSELVHVAKRMDSAALAKVLRHAVGGPCTTVVAACVADRNTAAQELLEGVSKVAAVTNRMSRSGSIRGFVDQTEEVIKQLRCTRNTENNSTADRLGAITATYRKILEDPMRNKRMVYDAMAQVLVIKERKPREITAVEAFPRSIVALNDAAANDDETN